MEEESSELGMEEAVEGVEVVVAEEEPADSDGDDDIIDHEDEMMVVEEELGGGEENGAAPVVVDCSVATISSHRDSVYCCALAGPGPSPTGGGGAVARVLTGGGDDTAFLSTLGGVGTSPTLLACSELKGGHTDSVSCCGFSADGTLAATGAYDGTVQIYSASTGEKVARLEGPDDIEWLAWHGQGNVIAAAGVDGTVWMWLAATGACMQVFAGHTARVTCGAFTSNGRTLVTGSEDGMIRVWAPKTGDCRHSFVGSSGSGGGGGGGGVDGAGGGFHMGPITCMAAHPDPEHAHLILSGAVDGTVCLVNVKTSRVLNLFDHDGQAHHGRGHGHAGGAAVQQQRVDAESSEAMAIVAVGFCLSQPWIASACTGGFLRAWDMSSGTHRLAMSHPAAVTHLSWVENLPQILTSCSDGILRLWDARSGGCLRELTGHRDMILTFDVQVIAGASDSDDHRHMVVATASDDRTCKIFYFD